MHPLADVTYVLYGRNNFNIPSYDHYSSELVLLYVVAIAVEELRHFREMTQRHPAIEIAGWQGTDKLCEGAWCEISYVCFKRPRIRYASAVTRCQFPTRKSGYYRDPMRRLVALHSGFHEIMTGLSFNSPWLVPTRGLGDEVSYSEGYSVSCLNASACRIERRPVSPEN